MCQFILVHPLTFASRLRMRYVLYSSVSGDVAALRMWFGSGEERNRDFTSEHAMPVAPACGIYLYRRKVGM